MTSTRRSQGPRGTGYKSSDPAMLCTPLDVIAADHVRDRQICADMDNLAISDSLDRELVQEVLRFLNEDLGIHIRDMAEDLFPLLRRRCPPEEDINCAITRITSDREAARALLPQIRFVLADCLDADRVPTPNEVAVLLCFTHHTYRHLSAENAILLPLARVRLTDRDLESLWLRMQARRGIAPTTETCHA